MMITDQGYFIYQSIISLPHQSDSKYTSLRTIYR